MRRILMTVLSAITIGLYAQETTSNDDLVQSVDGLKESYNETKNTVDLLSKIKITGYIQSQYQHADSVGAPSVAGGNFPAASMNRFSLRRGRVKIAYTGKNTSYVLQFDASTGGFEIKDVYMTVTEPFFKTATLQSGIFNRPFGYEIAYSSSTRETPERSRMYQVLFPGERDLGAAIELKSERGIFSYINLKGGFFNGTRNNVAENDQNKDFIGQLSGTLPIDKENGFVIDFGVSTYQGKVHRDFQTASTATGTATVNGTRVVTPPSSTKTQNYTQEVVNGSYAKTDSSYSPNVKRQYYGADVQIYIPYIGGTKILAEFITGIQPGTKASSGYYVPSNGDLYLRKFNGYYVTLVQNVTKHFQLMGRYDVYDPNTSLSGTGVKTTGDIKYTTIGGGLSYIYDSNLKFTFFYDMVSNEKTKLAGYTGDAKDNVLTIRAQYKF